MVPAYDLGQRRVRGLLRRPGVPVADGALQGHQSFNSSPMTSVARALTIVFIYFLALEAHFRLLWSFLQHRRDRQSKKVFTAVWIVPALCFFTFIFLKLVNSGYLLLVAAPPVCGWALGCGLVRQGPLAQSSKALHHSGLRRGECPYFVAFPAYFSYRSCGILKRSCSKQ